MKKVEREIIADALYTYAKIRFVYFSRWRHEKTEDARAGYLETDAVLRELEKLVRRLGIGAIEISNIEEDAVSDAKTFNCTSTKC